MTPAALMLRPAGKLPALMVNVKAPRPPVAATVWLYAVPSTPAASAVVVIDGGAGKLMAMLRACVAVCVGLLESVTITVKFAVTFGPVGVPEIRPALLRAKPAGTAPALVVNVSVPNPVAATIWLYAVPSTPAGSVVVVKVGAAGKLTRILRAWVAVIGVMLLESVTLTVKLAVQLGPVGVPEIGPVPLRVRPAGNVPALMENVTVPAPPVFAIA